MRRNQIFWTGLIVFMFLAVRPCLAESDSTSVKPEHRPDYQIHLPHPAKEIKLIMYEKNFLPIQGKLSPDRKSVILKDYELGTKVRVKLIYEDGTADEFVRTPCFIDPVVL